MINTKYPDLYENFILKVKKYITKESDISKINEAFVLAEQCHEGQYRREGCPYITHPIEVACILCELNAGPETLQAALLHDTVEDTDLKLEDVLNQFGQSVSDLVDGVTKISKIEFKKSANKLETHQKMLLAMAKDIRVVIIKLADRLHNMRTMKAMPPDHQKRIGQETLDIYAPLAHRLGMFRIKAELEDSSLKYVDPQMYYHVTSLVQTKKSQREISIAKIIDDISRLLETHNVFNFFIKGRIKNINSIYKKLVGQKRDFEDIYDLLAIRIIVDKIEDCYQALGIIHANFTPIPKRFKDYIAIPKPNLYQSLHTTVLANDGTLFEVQIRTKEMDDIAEFGIAAHWAYKESKTYSKEREQFELAQKLKWYSDLLKLTSDKDEQEKDAQGFVDTVKTDILKANVYVFTPSGDVIELPMGSCPIDFAYMIHTDVGHKMVGATINNKIAPINTKLKTGDIVAIKTNKNANPSEDWLKIVTSSHARTKIKAYLNKINHDKIVQRGKDELEKEISRLNITATVDDIFVSKNFSKQQLSKLDDMYLEIGKGMLSVKTVVAKIEGKEIDKEELLQKQMEKQTRILTTSSDTGIYVDGLTNPRIKLGQCCNPVLDEKILGYVTKNSGIVVHCTWCPNVKQLEEDRALDVYWASNITRKYGTMLVLNTDIADNILQDVVTTINAASIGVAEMKVSKVNSMEQLMKVRVLVKNLSDLNVLMLNLKKIEGVYNVERGIR